MLSTVQPSNEGMKEKYNQAAAVPLKFLLADGSIVSVNKSALGEQVMPPDPARAELYNKAPAIPLRYLLPDGSVHEGSPMFGVGAESTAGVGSSLIGG